MLNLKPSNLYEYVTESGLPARVVSQDGDLRLVTALSTSGAVVTYTTSSDGKCERQFDAKKGFDIVGWFMPNASSYEAITSAKHPGAVFIKRVVDNKFILKVYPEGEKELDLVKKLFNVR